MFLQPQWAQFGLHSLRPLLDVFSQETNLAPRKRGFFFAHGSADAIRESYFRSLCRRALEIGADRQRTRIGFLEIGDGRVEIEQADVADDEPLDARVLGDAADDRR